jgi:hypothetical protein
MKYKYKRRRAITEFRSSLLRKRSTSELRKFYLDRTGIVENRWSRLTKNWFEYKLTDQEREFFQKQADQNNNTHNFNIKRMKKAIQGREKEEKRNKRRNEVRRNNYKNNKNNEDIIMN